MRREECGRRADDAAADDDIDASGKVGVGGNGLDPKGYGRA
jgi:hypothetical protein